MRPLFIGKKELDELDQLRIRAAKNPIDVVATLAKLNTEEGKAAHKRLVTSQSIELPVGYLVSFTIETGHPAGTCRHMTLGVMQKDYGPSLDAVRMVAEALGFVGGVSCCAIWLDKTEGHGLGVNLVQPVDVAAAGRA